MRYTNLRYKLKEFVNANSEIYGDWRYRYHPDPNDKNTFQRWEKGETEINGSIETLGPAIDKYELSDFAQEDWPRFSQLISHLSPRDQEIMLLFAVLRKRPTDLSILFGKAG